MQNLPYLQETHFGGDRRSSASPSISTRSAPCDRGCRRSMGSASRAESIGGWLVAILI